MNDIVERLRTSASQAGYPKHYIYDEAADEIERLRLIINTIHPQMQLQIDALTAERDDWVEQARKAMDDAEAREAAARREGIEAAASVASKRAASRHSTVAHCHSDRSKKHMQIRADEAGQLVADIRALLEDGR